jgi:hypothetical protein
MKAGIKDIFKVVPLHGEKKPIPDKFDEKQKVLRRLLQIGKNVQRRLKGVPSSDSNNDLLSAEYPKLLESHSKALKKGRRKPRSKSSKKCGAKSSTVSYTLNLIVDEDRVKRIQSAHAVRRSKERDTSSVSYPGSHKLSRERDITSSGLIFDDWCFK